MLGALSAWLGEVAREIGADDAGGAWWRVNLAPMMPKVHGGAWLIVWA